MRASWRDSRAGRRRQHRRGAAREIISSVREQLEKSASSATPEEQPDQSTSSATPERGLTSAAPEPKQMATFFWETLKDLADLTGKIMTEAVTAALNTNKPNVAPQQRNETAEMSGNQVPPIRPLNTNQSTTSNSNSNAITSETNPHTNIKFPPFTGKERWDICSIVLRKKLDSDAGMKRGDCLKCFPD